jgi:hypothetical protein
MPGSLNETYVAPLSSTRKPYSRLVGAGTVPRPDRAFASVGYWIAWLQPFDLMPEAGPVDTAVYLERG